MQWPTTKKELLEQFLNGSSIAFEKLYKLYKPFIRTYIKQEVPNGNIDDIEQEIWFRVHKKRKQIDTVSSPFSASSFSAYLCTLIKHAIINAKQKLQSQSKTQWLAELNHEREKQNDNDYISLEETIIDPDSELNENEIEGRQKKIDKVQETLDKLPAKYAYILRLLYNEEMSYENIADILGIPLGTIKSRINTAKKLFEEKYESTN